MNMIKTVGVLVLLSFVGLELACANGTYYLVRHAEKQVDGTPNPSLSEQGRVRANFLAQHLSLAGITKIYSTDYRRTRQTAEPLAELLGITVASYNPEKLDDFANLLKTQTGQILIVGHSNTTPILASLLSGKTVAAIEDDEYDNLYQIMMVHQQVRLTRFKLFPIDTAQVEHRPRVSD